jgi:hypothetical protein
MATTPSSSRMRPTLLLSVVCLLLSVVILGLFFPDHFDHDRLVLVFVAGLFTIILSIFAVIQSARLLMLSRAISASRSLALVGLIFGILGIVVTAIPWSGAAFGLLFSAILPIL